jgi:hypothetical protein
VPCATGCEIGLRCCESGAARRVRGSEFVRAPACSHRVLDARWCRESQPADGRDGPAGHARGGHDRPRQHVRGLRVLPAGGQGRREAGHRDRGLPGPGVAVPQEAGVLGRGRPAGRRPGRRGRRRLGRRRLHPHDDAGRGRGRAAQPVPAVQPGVPGGLLPQAADGPRADRRARQGDHRHHRVPVGRGADPAAARPAGQGAGRGGRLPGHLRGGQLLPGADGARPGHRAVGPGRAAGDRPEAGPAPAGHQRQPLRDQGPGARARGPAVRRHRPDHGRPEAVQARRRRLLHQAGRGDAPDLGRQRAGGVRQHAAHRRAGPALRRRVQARRPDAEVPGARGRDAGLVAAQGGGRRHRDAVRRRSGDRGQRAHRVRAHGHREDGLPGLLPGRGRHLPARAGGQDRARPGPRVGHRVDGGLRAGHHRPGPDRALADLRAVPQPRAHLHAGHRPGLRRARPGRHDPLRHRQVRR